MMWWGNDSGNTSGVVMMGVVMLLGLAVAVAVTVWVVRSVRGSASQRGIGGNDGTDPHTDRTTAYDDPERVLARRFAAGEIDEAQFDHSRAVLHRDPPRR